MTAMIEGLPADESSAIARRCRGALYRPKRRAVGRGGVLMPGHRQMYRKERLVPIRLRFAE